MLLIHRDPARSIHCVLVSFGTFSIVRGWSVLVLTAGGVLCSLLPDETELMFLERQHGMNRELLLRQIRVHVFVLSISSQRFFIITSLVASLYCSIKFVKGCKFSNRCCVHVYLLVCPQCERANNDNFHSFIHSFIQYSAM